MRQAGETLNFGGGRALAKICVYRPCCAQSSLEPLRVPPKVCAMDIALTEQIAKDLCRSKGWDTPAFIAAGNSAAVFKAKHPEHGPIALKIYDPSFFAGDNALIEENRIRLQEKLRSHGNEYLIDVLEVGKITEANTWFLMMELCPWKTLEDQIEFIPDSNVGELLRQLVNVVQFLEDNGLVHRDIKPANIAISDDFVKLKLLDLGVMRHISPTEGNGTDRDEKRRFIATAQYSSPEYLTREELPGDIGFRALNIYQIGAVLHDLIMKTAIFAEEAATLNKYILYKAITTKRPLLVNPNLPARLIVLCKTALDKNPTARVNGVTLRDLATPIDTSDALRKRLGAQRTAASSNSTMPSVLIWRQRVRDWIATAARRERDVLGPHRLVPNHGNTSGRWTLSFSLEPNSLNFDLAPSADGTHLQLSLSANVPEVLTVPLLEIFETGAQMDDEEVTSRICEHILYMLDLSRSSEN